MEKKINFRILLSMLLMVLTTMYAHAQEWETKALKWNTDSVIAVPDFENTDQIKEWGKNGSDFAQVKSETVRLKDGDIFILAVSICSGTYCPHIYIFRQDNQHWKLISTATARLRAQMEIQVDQENEKIIFRTKSARIGELPFAKVKVKL